MHVASDEFKKIQNQNRKNTNVLVTGETTFIVGNTPRVTEQV